VRSAVSLALLVLAPLPAAGNVARGAAADPANPVECIQFWPEVEKHSHAYDHFVHLTSRCATPARCEVSGDSNPAPVQVVVVPNHERRVLIARASPAATFVPRVLCRFKPIAHPERRVASENVSR
jgi:hypothetical protein